MLTSEACNDITAFFGGVWGGEVIAQGRWKEMVMQHS